MGQHYRHLDSIERVKIMLWLKEGRSASAIARQLGRSPSTITREIARHQAMPGCGKLPYEATRSAHRAHLARFTRRRKRKLDVNGKLFAHVHEQMRCGLSPDQISGRLKRDHPNCYAMNISHEAIYTALYAMPRGELRRELIACLRQGHVNRWPRSRGNNRKNAGFISDDVLIHVRPPEVEDRLVRPGQPDRVWSAARILSRHTHGTGCTLSSAIATLLGRGEPLEAAIEGARDFVREALRAAPGFGAGHGPMGHQAVGR